VCVATTFTIVNLVLYSPCYSPIEGGGHTFIQNGSLLAPNFSHQLLILHRSLLLKEGVTTPIVSNFIQLLPMDARLFINPNDL